jgi:flagellar basal body P-ring protein FlgI
MASTTLAELYALGDEIKEARILRNVLTESGIEHQTGTLVLEYNTAATVTAEGPKHHTKGQAHEY